MLIVSSPSFRWDTYTSVFIHLLACLWRTAAAINEASSNLPVPANLSPYVNGKYNGKYIFVYCTVHGHAGAFMRSLCMSVSKRGIHPNAQRFVDYKWMQRRYVFECTYTSIVIAHAFIAVGIKP
jgi:hypothetical protein